MTTNTPSKHWGFSENHNYLLNEKINAVYRELYKFISDEMLCIFFKGIDKRVSDINLFINNIPVFTSISRDGEIFNSLFIYNEHK